MTMLRQVLEHILDLELRAFFTQNGPVWSHMRNQELNRTFPKTLKNHEFLQVFAPTHLPRDHPWAQNCSQEAAKKIHNIKKNAKNITVW